MVFQETCLTCGNRPGGVPVMGKEENVYGTPRDKLDLWQQAGRCVCYGQRGIDFLYGVPRDILDLWQQAGRCAHYGQRGIVYLYKINSSSFKDDNMKAVLNEPTECLRRTILKDFVLRGYCTSGPYF